MDIRPKTRKRQSTYEQKLHAINEVREKKRHKQDVAEEMNIHINSLNLWLKQFREHGPEGLQSHYQKPNLLEHDEELHRLQEIEKKYNEQQDHIEILKKFQAFLKESE